MDVNDQTKAVNQARDRYREAQEDLRASYDKNLGQMKETFDAKNDKRAKNFAIQKTKLEEQNQVNNELYSEKAKSAISRGQEEFKTKIRENTAKFDKERSETKNELADKLSNLSESYKKSFDENSRYQDQIKKSMGERYASANKRYQEDFNTQVANLDKKSTKADTENRQTDRDERLKLSQKNFEELENLRSSSSEQKFKEISRLKNDTESLRTTLERDKQMLKDRQEERVADLMSLKSKEGDDIQRNFQELQKDLRQKNINSQERQNASHKRESKELEAKFNDDIRNIQRVADQKVKGGTQADNLHDELKQTKSSFDSRLQAARDEVARNSLLSSEKEENIDSMYREKLKQMKMSSIEAMSKKELESNAAAKKNDYENNQKNTALIDRFQSDTNSMKKSHEDRMANVTSKSRDRIAEQRVEFGRAVNSMNDKNMETINSLKEDFSKDKTASIEKSKKDFNSEKVSLKNEFNRQANVREKLYEQKLADIERQTNKIIENYENRISQIVRKAENEVETVKITEAERNVKEAQASKVAIENLRNQSNIELSQMREKYEGKIARDRAMTENQTNKIVQKYEDQLVRERFDQQKEMSLRLGEAQAQFERLYKSSEMEKETLRSQYEQRMENMKLASLTQENSKKV